MAEQFTDYLGNPISPKVSVVQTLKSGTKIGEINGIPFFAPSNSGSGGESSRSVKIICFGNSFTQDSMSYVPTILSNIAPSLQFVIAIAYIGGSPLAKHCANFTGISQIVDGTTYEVETYTYYKFSSSNPGWVREARKNVDYILGNEDWDIVTFQQGGATAPLSWAVHYEPFIYTLHKKVFEKVSKSVKLGWLSVHGSYGSSIAEDLTKFNGTIANSQKLMEETGTELLFPYGTAVQNLRSTPLQSLGAYGDLKYDTAHLQEGIGCLVAAYANALTVLNAVGLSNLSVVGDNTRPNDTWAEQNLVIGAQGETIGMTEDNVFTAQMAAIQAVKNPYEITDCNIFYQQT